MIECEGNLLSEIQADDEDNFFENQSYYFRKISRLLDIAPQLVPEIIFMNDEGFCIENKAENSLETTERRWKFMRHWAQQQIQSK